MELTPTQREALLKHMKTVLETSMNEAIPMYLDDAEEADLEVYEGMDEDQILADFGMYLAYSATIHATRVPTGAVSSLLKYYADRAQNT